MNEIPREEQDLCRLYHFLSAAHKKETQIWKRGLLAPSMFNSMPAAIQGSFGEGAGKEAV